MERSGVNAPCRDFGFGVALGGGWMHRPAVELAFAGFKSRGGPCGGRSGVGEEGGEALREDVAEGLLQRGRIAARRNGGWIEERGKKCAAGREVDEEFVAGLPVGRGLENGWAAEAAMSDEHFLAKADFGAAAGSGFDFSGDTGQRGPAGFLAGEDQWNERGTRWDDVDIELAGDFVAETGCAERGNGQAASGYDESAGGEFARG